MAQAPLLRIRGVSKNYGPVQANRTIDLDVDPQSIHAVLGENGAGKSTLMKLIYGVEQPDEGQIEWQGREVRPADADLPPGIRLERAHLLDVEGSLEPGPRTRHGVQRRRVDDLVGALPDLRVVVHRGGRLTLGRGGRGRDIGDATTLADSSVMNFIAQGMPSGGRSSS